MPYRTCERCGKKHLTNSPLCGGCRHKGSKRPCPIDGCTERINPAARTCVKHRLLGRQTPATHCRECGVLFERPLVRAVCDSCRLRTRVLCACGCGRYRKKYGPSGQVYEYVSGHNDNWKSSRRPLATCAVCGKKYKSVSSRSKICSLKCRTQWLTINPPNERKRIPIPCAACGKVVYRAPYQLKAKGIAPSCSKQCRYIIVANKLSGPRSDVKRLALRRDNMQCALCGFDIVVHVHHILPKHKGGKDSLDNLITLCPNHHAMAHRNYIDSEVLLRAVKTSSPVSVA